MSSVLACLTNLILLVQSATTVPPAFSAKLHAAHDALAPGTQTELAIEISVSDPWHLYHPILLDTGIPTVIEFDLPQGLHVGAQRFPRPTFDALEVTGDLRIEYLELRGRFVVLTTLSADPSLEPGQTVEITADVSGLACVEQCLPVRTVAKLRLPIKAERGASANEKLFAEARRPLPAPLSKAPYLEGSALRVSKDTIGIDEPAELIAKIRIRQAHHIQDRDPGVDGLVASRLFIEQIDGIEFAEHAQQKWDEPHVRRMQYFGEVREQSGELTIRVPFKITDKKFPAGPVVLRALFHYQCCTDAGVCYPPEWAETWVRFTADTPNETRDDLAALVPSDEASLPGNAAVPVNAAIPGDAVSKAADASPDSPPTGSAAEIPTIPELTDGDWANGIPWIDWQPGLAEELSRRGRRVFVDYTAEWCLNCKANEKLVLETETIRTKMREMGVIPIKADFTNYNPQMSADIKSHGRLGVPVYLVFAPKTPDRPGVLPELLTQNTVLRGLENPAAFAPDAARKKHILLVLLAGLIGGFILNFTPCVLPVVSIKILSFVQQAGQNPKRVFRLGLAFCAGIMIWFWAFAALRMAGNVPLQSPMVNIALGSLIFVLSLSLFGVFEIMLPGRTAGTLDQLASREGYAGAFMKGLLATLLGTACMAPYLGFALGYALRQPKWVGFTIFTAAGVGMAAPYLILSAKPGWLKYVPKPGPWMVTFKQATGFVLLGTAVWLLLVLSKQLDGEGVVWTVAFFGFLALAAWMIGKIRPTWQTSRRISIWVASLAVAAFGFYFCFFVMYDLLQRPEIDTADRAIAADASAGAAGPAVRVVRSGE